MAYKGVFRPNNPEKYTGDPTSIIYRSRWELILMGTLDKHPDVLKWGSEEIIIPYRSPIDGRVHRYFQTSMSKKEMPQMARLLSRLLRLSLMLKPSLLKYYQNQIEDTSPKYRLGVLILLSGMRLGSIVTRRTWTLLLSRSMN